MSNQTMSNHHEPDLYTDNVDSYCFCDDCMEAASRQGQYERLELESAQWVLTGIDVMEQIANKFKPIVSQQ